MGDRRYWRRNGYFFSAFLQKGYRVIAVEPNREMREKAEELLQQFPGFNATNGTAEHTGLPDSSIDAIIAGQAYHWFDAGKAKTEFIRILKPGRPVVLIWNERQTHSPFGQEYDQLIHKHGRDYVAVQHRNIDAGAIAAFYAPAIMSVATFENEQVFDFEGLKGRLVSSSYMPAAGEAGYDAMIADLKLLFEKYAESNQITIHYQTLIYSGNPSA